MGRNGAGKSSLLWALQGSGPRRSGTVDVGGADPADAKPAVRRTLVGLLPQSAADLLYLETVDEECAAGGEGCRELLDSLVPDIPGDRHPRDLSEGQRLALALALVLAARPPVVLLDEPTRGLDYAAKRGLARILRGLADDGRPVLVSTHDVEFAALVADDVVVLAEGEVVSSGPVRRVLAESPAFAPQVMKVLGPPWLRVDEVAAARAAVAEAAPGEHGRDGQSSGRSRCPAARRSILSVASVGGLMMLVWPLLVRVTPESRVDPPFIFLALLPVVIAVILAELSEGGLDTRVLAMLGVLSAVIAILRGVSAGTGGVELVFFMLILAGRVFGPGFGFVLGVTSLFASALMTAGVGPWLPFQMLVSAWVGMGAGLLPRRVTGRAEIAMLAAYGVFAAYAFGLLMNLSSWPFLLGISVPGHEATAISFDPTAPLAENLQAFLVYTLITSTTQLRHRPGDHQRGRDRRARPGRAGHPAPGRHGGRRWSGRPRLGRDPQDPVVVVRG